MVDVVMVGNVPGCDRFSRQARQSYPGRLVSLPGLEVAFRLGSGRRERSPHVVALVRLRPDRPRGSDVRHWRDLIARVEHVNARGDIRLARAGVRVARAMSPSLKQTPAKDTMALGGGSALSTVN
jgi:hypothetical protein